MKRTSLLSYIESVGNRLPHPTLLFIASCGGILILSALLSSLGISAQHPSHGGVMTVRNLLSTEGVHFILENTVSNFITFAPVGTVLVAVMGMGIAERSGLISRLLRSAVQRAKHTGLSFIVVLTGVLSSLAADTGYVILIPLAAILFKSAGRHPLAGIAAAFAGVSGGFSANLLIGPVDVILAGISSEAAALVDKSYTVHATGNYYFIAASTLLISLLGTAVTEGIIGRRFIGDRQTKAAAVQSSAAEQQALRAVSLFTLGTIGVLLWGLIPTTGFLRAPETGSILQSPLMNGIVTVIAVYAAMAGMIYGRISGNFADNTALVTSMEKSMATMASYLVLIFFAAQFVHYFAWSHMGSVIAIKGASVLAQWGLSPALLLIGFVFMTALVNIFVGSASAKWALIAPIFVPMLLLVGISPEATQMAFRIGDSATNIITPLMPYFGVVLAFAQQHDKHAGIGTIAAMMLPYSVAFLVGWSLMLGLWIFFDLPLGPGASILL